MASVVSETLQELVGLVTQFAKSDGVSDTVIPNLKLIRNSVKNEKINTIYKPSMCIILQGKKKVILADEIFQYSPSQFMAGTVDLPITGQVTEASSEKPYLCLMIELDPAMIYDIIKDSPADLATDTSTKRSLFVGKCDPCLMDPTVRLIRCLKNPKDITVLVPMIMRELIYRLIESEHGNVIKQLGIVGSQAQRIAKVINLIKRDYAKTLKSETLALAANMSVSSFHQHFKQMTAMSPLQYQKQIRLQEARRLLIAETGDAASVGFQVGYESPSQFSREYSRMFGLPPVSDLKRLKHASI